MNRKSSTGSASIETTLELWASSLRDVKERMRPLFARERSAVYAGLFLDGLLSEERRKTGWMRAEATGDPGPWRQQELLARDRWDADALRDVGRDYVVEHLADEDAVLVVDETGFLKQGKASCGVARQYTGCTGKTPLAPGPADDRVLPHFALQPAGSDVGAHSPTGSYLVLSVGLHGVLALLPVLCAIPRRRAADRLLPWCGSRP
jgi:hypothetical protein